MFPIWESPPLARQNSVAETLLSPSILEAIPDADVAVNRQGVILQANSGDQGPVLLHTRRTDGSKDRDTRAGAAAPGSTIVIGSNFTPNPKFGAWGQGSISTAGGAMGRSFLVEISLSPIVTADGTIVLSVIREISDRKRSARATLTSP